LTVNGTGPEDYLIHTCSNHRSLAGKADVAELQRKQMGTVKLGTVTDVNTVGGQDDNLPLLPVGNIQFTNVPSHIGSYNAPDEYLPDIGGVLGLDLFDDRLLTLDYCHRRVVVESGELPQGGKDVIEYDNREGVPYVNGTLGGQQLTLVLDTGSDRALDLPTEVLRSQFLASFPRSLGSSHGLAGETHGIGEVPLEDPLIIGSARFEHARATFSAAWPVPIIGSALLRKATITFDQKHNRMKITQGSKSTG